MENINVYDSDGNSINCLAQWDKDVYIYIDEPSITMDYNVDFYNDISDAAFMVQTEYTDKLKAKIPNELLTQPYPVKGYVIVTHDTETKSYYGFMINLKLRPRPSDYIYTEDDDYVRLDTILNQCKQAAAAAEAAQQKAAKSEENAAKSAQAAQTAQESAQASAEAAKGAQDWSLWAQSYAVGTGGKREGEETDNAKYYYDLVKKLAVTFDTEAIATQINTSLQRIEAIENELSASHVPGYADPEE